MINRYFATMLICVPVIFTGCIGEDWSLCPPEDNVRLHYRYPDEKGTDVFAENIAAVDLILFDQDLHLEGIYHSDKDLLKRFQGIYVTLPPGEYTVVALGNPGPDTHTHITTFFDSTIDTEDGNGGLPLYYAPAPSATARSLSPTADLSVYTIVIPPKGTIEKTLDFKRAHRTISVLVKNYIHPQWGTDPELEVKIAHMAHRYNLQMQVSPLRMDYTTRTELKETPDGRMQGMKINTPYQEIEDELHITITTPDGQLICPRIYLKEFLLSEGISLEATSIHEINILVSFSDGEVTLRLTDWNDNQVSPVW